MKIDVAKQYGQHLITSDDGEALNKVVRDTLNRGEVLELDFSGASVFASPFFNASIGALLEHYSPDDLNTRLTFRGLSAENQLLLRRVIKNARQYFAEPTVRRAVDEMNTDSSGEHRL